MMRSALPSLLVLVALCSACAPEPPQLPAPSAPAAAAAPIPAPPQPARDTVPPTQAIPRPAPDLLGWWDRPEALARLDLTAADAALVATELRRFERSYQTAQRQLYTVSRTQLQMLRDPKVPSADIRRFQQRNTLALTTSMMDADIAARIAVRGALSADRLARMLEQSPEFFGLSWFRAAVDPLIDTNQPAAPASLSPQPVDQGAP